MKAGRVHLGISTQGDVLTLSVNTVYSVCFLLRLRLLRFGNLSGNATLGNDRNDIGENSHKSNGPFR